MTRDWRNGLLASSLPLEFEATSILIDKGFHVRGEFPYTRQSGNDITEFSVDLHAHHYLAPDSDVGGIGGHLDILCECKFRSPEKSWVFTPDLNHPDFSPFTSSAIRHFSMFSAYSFDHEPLRHFSRLPTPVIKGVEFLRDGSHKAYDTDIRHGLNQLRYALPSMAAVAINEMLDSHPNDSKPRFILPILLTNAEIFVLKKGVTIDTVRNCENIEDIMDPESFIEVYSPHPNEFSAHSKRAFQFNSLEYYDTQRPSVLRLLEDYWMKEKGMRITTPRSELARIFNGGVPNPDFYSQFIVTTLSRLPELLDTLLSNAKKSVEGGNQIVGNSR